MKQITTLKVKIAFTLLFSFFVGTQAQNLVHNGDFENMTQCPDGLSKVNGYIDYISTPSEGTTDVFSKCARGKNGVPRNFRGYQKPKSGKTYMGMYLFAGGGYKEYIQLQLKQQLVAGEKYTLKFYVSLAEDSQFSVKEVNALFTGKKMNFKNTSTVNLRDVGEKYGSYSLKNMKAQARLTNTKIWIPVELDYTADGFEKFLTIGSFGKVPKDYLIKVPNPAPGSAQMAYFYIDDVKLTKQSNIDLDIDYNESFVLDKVNFDENSATLDNASKDYLKELYASLANPENDKVVLKGHTDNIGSQEYNLMLSEKRVASVKAYLASLGMPADNIKIEAYGEKHPLYNGLDMTSLRKNRRVEFVITEFEDFQE